MEETANSQRTAFQVAPHLVNKISNNSVLKRVQALSSGDGLPDEELAVARGRSRRMSFTSRARAGSFKKPKGSVANGVRSSQSCVPFP